MLFLLFTDRQTACDHIFVNTFFVITFCEHFVTTFCDPIFVNAFL